METLEIWKDIPGYEDLYQISNFGNIKSIRTSDSMGRCKLIHIINPNIRKDGYKRVCLFKNGTPKKFYLHRILSSAFLGLSIDDTRTVVCHKDDNPSNNRLDNLFLGTQNENIKDCISKGRFSFGENCKKNILQFSKNGEFIREWESIISVRRELKIHDNSIIKCCKGIYKQAGGFIWKYK